MTKAHGRDRAPRRGPDALVLSTVLFLAGHALSALFHLNAGKLVFGLLLLACVPGALVVRILFSRAHDVDRFERGVLSLASSVIIGMCIALLLNLVPGGLHSATTLPAFWGIAIGLLLIAKRPTTGPAHGTAPASSAGHHLLGQLKARHSRAELAAYSIASFAAVLFFILLVALVLRAKDGAEFTEFYILDENGKADPALLELSTHNATPFTLGIANNTQAAATYYVEGELHEQVIYRSDSIHLQHGESTALALSLLLPPDAAGARLVLRLYSYGQPAPASALYLQVRE